MPSAAGERADGRTPRAWCPTAWRSTARCSTARCSTAGCDFRGMRWISGGARIYTHMNTKTRWVLALTGIGSLMAALDTVVVSTALTTIHRSLGASVEQLEWTVNAYNVSFAVLLITGAALGDRYGRRRGYAAGLALFSLA